ncbi:ER degradation-enhancing alpha-mannosidase-like protein 2 isoform X2 [Etheostoma cragini]|uniref:ER degradation-enhancing alpha-mannosidase-like protein 2 isoform X2 n=1 Tax=Etheostoma cragini TaxID=417921 RepID=UPI00155ED49A|nr:ER degradation-enhancing alpha-mannosidase-like protein 2 isoform X2 [Etheostoma cragini]
MESFFLAETIKYLYLLFDPAHFLHGGGAEGDGSWEAGGEDGQCVLGAGGFIFNTEAHPLDAAALHCCSQHAAERRALADILLRRAQDTQGPPPGQSQTQSPPPCQSESIALKPGEKKTPPALSCPVQPFSARLAVLGQVFTDNT